MSIGRTTGLDLRCDDTLFMGATTINPKLIETINALTQHAQTFHPYYPRLDPKTLRIYVFSDFSGSY